VKTRLISRLDIKGSNLIKGIQLEGLRIVGDPNAFAQRYYQEGVDELLLMDSVASLYGRNQLDEIIERITADIFIPITVGGGLRNLEDCRRILRSGADKIAINTAAITSKNLITEIANEFGSQCMVVSIDAKKISESKWDAYTNNGREPTGIDVVDWASICEELGAGEILLTSIDREGTRSGFDISLVEMVTNTVNIPVIASGGLGNTSHFSELINRTKVDAIAIADAFHYSRVSVKELREIGLKAGREMRNINE
jgi:cyclase